MTREVQVNDMIRRGLRLASLLLVLVAVGCAPKGPSAEDTAKAAADSAAAAQAMADSLAKAAAANTMPVAPATPPEHIKVQHVLIGFVGKIPGKNVTRTQEEAEKLAAEILERARKGEDFDQLVEQYTDDQPPGIYGLANTGVTPSGQDEYPRNGMVKGFSDVAFSLSPGNIDVAKYDPKDSPYGWHIIKRIK